MSSEGHREVTIQKTHQEPPRQRGVPNVPSLQLIKNMHLYLFEGRAEVDSIKVNRTYRHVRSINTRTIIFIILHSILNVPLRRILLPAHKIDQITYKLLYPSPNI